MVESKGESTPPAQTEAPRQQPASAALVEAAQKVWDGGDVHATIQIEASEKLRAFMAGHGVVSLETTFITDSDMRHIRRRHANNERERGQLEIGPLDFGLLPEILNDFDSCQYSCTDNLGNKKFLITKMTGAPTMSSPFSVGRKSSK